VNKWGNKLESLLVKMSERVNKWGNKLVILLVTQLDDGWQPVNA
jgi:hypothetical protein